MEYMLGIDLGGTQIKAVGLEIGTGRRVWESVRLTGDGDTLGGRPAWTTAVLEAVLEAGSALGELNSAGLCAPGLVAGDGRSIVSMPGRMAGLERLDWTVFLERWNLVPVLNDAHAALVGEVFSGAARGLKNVYMLTLGTGVGGAVIVDGRLVRGHIGRAGHLGHVTVDMDAPPDITGMPGGLEDFIGDCSVRARTGGRFADTRGLVDAYAAGDASATEAWLRSVGALACGIASLNNVLDPEAVILGGGVAAAGPFLFEPLERELARIEWRPLGAGVPLRSAELGGWAGAVGAAYHGWACTSGENAVRFA